MLAHTTTSGTLLYRLAGGGDVAAWHEFVVRYEELIRGFVRRQNVALHDVDDVVQDVFMGLSTSMPGFRYDPAKGKFRSYLKTVTLHAVFRRGTRQKAAGVPLDLVETAAGPQAEAESEAAWEQEWRQYHLRQAMRTVRAEFGDADMQAFELYVQEGRDPKDVAEELKISIDRVYQAKSRLMRRLGEVIRQQVEDEG